jgi:hypothetical protein
LFSSQTTEARSMALHFIKGFHQLAADLQNLALFSFPGTGNERQLFLD